MKNHIEICKSKQHIAPNYLPGNISGNRRRNMELVREALDASGLDGRDVLGSVLEVLGGIDLLLVVLDLEAGGLLLGGISGILRCLL
jgi:hypothetical protein